MIWGSSAYRLQAFGHAIPVSWLVSADACFSVAASVAMLAIWRGLARSNRLPGDLTRIAIGAFIAAAAPLVLALASAEVAAGGRRVSLAWAVAFHIIDNIGMAAVWPVASAMFARLAPRPVAALMMGALNFDGFGGALAIGFLGTLLGRMTGVHFWLLQSGLVAIGALAVLLLRRADDRYSAVARAKSYQSSPR